jgi:glycogen debranching enzyme
MKLLSLVVVLAALTGILNAGTPLVDRLGISVIGTTRQFAYTNKQAGTYYGEVNAQNSGGWQGWFINAQKILDDYSFELNGKAIDRTTASTTVFPYQLIRKYPNGIEERFTFLDSVNALLVEFTFKGTKKIDPSMGLQVAPGFEQEKSSTPSFSLWQMKAAPVGGSVPTWIGLSSKQSSSRSLYIIVASSSSNDVQRLSLNIAKNAERMIAARKERMERLLRMSYLETNDQELDIALMWAKLSLDALIMNQSQSGIPVKGIFAGLPWFNNYWGRDSFISLPGATFVTGNFNDAREILLSFARFQEKDSSSTNYGRIPNIVTPTSIAYNTADGTPWFVKQMYDYIKYSDDTALIRELFPVIKRSIEGTIKYHTDSLGFLTHGDAESWMDAVGPNGPWSPRGNRACDVEALWYYQLLIGSFEADYLGKNSLGKRWKTLADRVEKNFNMYFVDRENKLVYDHLNADGSPSRELRPNQLFCLDIINSEDIREAMVKTVTSNLIYEHGVGTLSQSDSNFHPFHHYEPYYVQDAAYHNGIVWTWLSGHAIYALTRNDEEDLTFAITKNMVHQILHRGCVGTLSELLDAQTRSGETEPRLSGAFSQAWSLAEFIRSFYQDYLGIGIDATAHTIRINPKLPTELRHVECTFRVGGSRIHAHYETIGDSIRITLKADTLAKEYAVSYLWVYHSGDAAYINATLTPSESLTIAHSSDAYSVYRNNKEIFSSRDSAVWYLRDFSPKAEFADLNLAQPLFNAQLPVLQGPSYPTLLLDDVRRTNAAAKILFNKEDPAGDDRGASGTYTYPSNVNFKPGSLDIVHATVRYDTSNAYFTLVFRDLVNPGWHPEYGFQLTLAAIAIHRGDAGATSVGANSQFTVNDQYRFDRLITVGGGIRIADEKGKVVCEYLPRSGDEKNPIGNIKGKSIEFSLPLKYLGKPTPEWKMTILIGAQDDHGGAGIGEFRAVERNGGEWIGGGKIHPSDSNVFDVLILE